MRECLVKNRKAFFHKWEHKADVVAPSMTIGGAPGGQVEYDVAIIEYEDGIVTECYPYEVQFIDRRN